MSEKAAEKSVVSRIELGLLGMEEATTNETVRRISAGFPYETLENLRDNTELSMGEIAHLAQINPRALSRRKREARLHADESDRVLRLSRVYARALGLFDGDLGRTRHWLSTPKIALGGKTPLDYARMDVGAHEVGDLIGRIEHGALS